MAKLDLPGTVRIASSASDFVDQASKALEEALLETLGTRGEGAVALSGGNTPRPVHQRIAESSAIDWTRVKLFWVDERAVPANHERSNYHGARLDLLDRLSQAPAGIFPMPTTRSPLSDGADAYQRTLHQAGLPLVGSQRVPRFDIVILGVGDDGHTASLFPGDPEVMVTDRSVVSVPAKPGREARLSLTAPVLQHATHLFVFATGASKKEALHRVAAPTGSLSETPARLIREAKGNVTWFLDRAACE